MASQAGGRIYFGQFEVTEQVFHSNQSCFALVNIKPLVPGHVLVVPHRIVPRLTDLTKTEIGDVFETVQTVERMLAKVYFRSSSDLTETNSTTQTVQGKPYDGSFNIAVQDGSDAGQSVVHVHCHIIPRVKGNIQGDGIYDMLASDEGNIGGHLWDRDRRPTPNGTFPKIEDENRKPRTMEEMKKEAVFFRREMEKLQSI